MRVTKNMLDIRVTLQYKQCHGGGNLQIKDEDIVPVTVRILKRTHRQLDELAAADLRPTSNLIRKILEDYTKEHYKPKKSSGPKSSGETVYDETGEPLIEE